MLPRLTSFQFEQINLSLCNSNSRNQKSYSIPLINYFNISDIIDKINKKWFKRRRRNAQYFWLTTAWPQKRGVLGIYEPRTKKDNNTAPKTHLEIDSARNGTDSPITRSLYTSYRVKKWEKNPTELCTLEGRNMQGNSEETFVCTKGGTVGNSGEFK